ncbi:MAG: PadR family transcriptional regulator [Kiritimatiellae bacterium]|nr:PadR family transcriptional regulator [Kiritimatiellia bacterium]
MNEGWITQLRKGVLEYCVLLVLKGGASYGYEIVQALKRMEDLEVGESTVYPILARLSEEGCLSRRKEASKSGPPRTYLSLTVAGQLRLEAMGSYWKRLERVMRELEAGAGARSEE